MTATLKRPIFGDIGEGNLLLASGVTVTPDSELASMPASYLLNVFRPELVWRSTSGPAGHGVNFLLPAAKTVSWAPLFDLSIPADHEVRAILYSDAFSTTVNAFDWSDVWRPDGGSTPIDAIRVGRPVHYLEGFELDANGDLIEYDNVLAVRFEFRGPGATASDFGYWEASYASLCRAYQPTIGLAFDSGAGYRFGGIGHVEGPFGQVQLGVGFSKQRHSLGVPAIQRAELRDNLEHYMEVYGDRRPLPCIIDPGSLTDWWANAGLYRMVASGGIGYLDTVAGHRIVEGLELEAWK